MISPLHPLDVVRYALGGGPGTHNRAYTLDSLGRQAGPRTSMIEAAWLSLPRRRRSLTSLAWSQSRRVAGIAVARPRSGPRTWEISHLLLTTEDDFGSAELLNQLSRGVARNGGERVFVRLQRSDPLADVAKRCGFIQCTHELLYKGMRRSTSVSDNRGLRVKRAADEYSLFRLYTASTPRGIRSTFGMTFGQWGSSRERSRGRSREFVLEIDGQIKGWVKTAHRFGVGQLITMVHPEEETSMAVLIDQGMSYLTRTGKVYCLVPEYQEFLQRLLFQRGYQAVSEYVTLVKSMVAPVRKEEAGQAVTIASI